MKQVDFLVIGSGLAGLAFCEQLRKADKTFHVIDKQSFNASKVASGLYNPVVLKRLNFIWQGKEQMELANSFYKNLEDFLNISVDQKLDILRLLNSYEEKNDWLVASDKENLRDYLTLPFVEKTSHCIKAPHGFGKMVNTGKIDTESLLNNYVNFLENNSLITFEDFDYDKLVISTDYFDYGEFRTSKILFAEGSGIIDNPFFKPDIVNGTKGELLIIKAPELKIDSIIKSSVFIIPLESDEYLVGSTYNWTDKTWNPTPEAKEEIISKLNDFLSCDYEIVNHFAGIRPTTKDRRPIIGAHPEYKNMYILNGLGTRGVLIAPYVAKMLFENIFSGKAIEKEINYTRFF